ncbi:MAG: EF-P lysine aminoacylase EpmA [Thioalkalispiraceae bacterium]
MPKNNATVTPDWRPTASIETLKTRARLLQQTRSFFYQRDVLEVETPILTSAGTTETHLDQFVVSSPLDDKHYYLITSPELAMKRLLAAGSGDIFQLTRVFRAGECGSQHQPEFTMLEWYRLGFDLDALMREVEALLAVLLGDKLTSSVMTLTYAQAFEQYLSIDPFSATIEELKQCFVSRTKTEPPVLEDKQAYLDLLMSHLVEPCFDPKRLTFVKHYPAEQASLARINETDPRVAERFEAFAGGLELANGFYELTDKDQQLKRMQEENQQRLAIGKLQIDIDQSFLAALEEGLPVCSGVAVGFDRLVMVVTTKHTIREVQSFIIDPN